MNWLVVVLGVGLAVVGAVAMYLGFDLAQAERGIQVERGWVMVVAGATLLAGGVVTLAIGQVLFRLEALARNFHAGPAARPDAARLDALPEAARARPRPGLAAPAIAAGAVAAAAAGMLAAHASGTGEQADPEADRLQDAAQDAADDAELAASTPIVVEAVVLEPPGPVAAHAPAMAPDHGHRPIPEPADLDDDWLDQALSGDGAGHVPEPTVSLAHPEAEDEPVDHAESAHPEVAHPEAVHPEAVPAEPAQTVIAHAIQEPVIAEATAPPAPEASIAQALVPHEEPPPAKTVVGRYNAAGVAYVMYQDGSIDADDGARLRQFASMADLKAHISNPE